MRKTLITRQERRRSFQSNRKNFSSFYRLLDMTVITMVYLSVLLVDHFKVDLTSIVLLLVCTISYNFCAEAVNLYRLGRAPSNLVMLKTISMVWCLASFVTAIFAFLFPSSLPYSTNLILMFNLALTLPTLLILRALFTQIISLFRIKGYNTRTAIIIGSTPAGYKLANEFEEEKHLGIHFMGFYEDRKSSTLYLAMLVGHLS
jgi:putative colanic acid biosynthesis UDP-glucose lipid carrier transferase